MDWSALDDRELWNAVVETNKQLIQLDAQQEFLSTGFSEPVELDKRAERAANNLRSLDHLRLKRESLIAELGKRNLADLERRSKTAFADTNSLPGSKPNSHDH